MTKARYESLYSEYRTIEGVGTAHVTVRHFYYDYSNCVSVIRLWVSKSLDERDYYAEVEYGPGFTTLNAEANIIRKAIAMFDEYVGKLAPYADEAVEQ